MDKYFAPHFIKDVIILNLAWIKSNARGFCGRMLHAMTLSIYHTNHILMAQGNKQHEELKQEYLFYSHLHLIHPTKFVILLSINE